MDQQAGDSGECASGYVRRFCEGGGKCKRLGTGEDEVDGDSDEGLQEWLHFLTALPETMDGKQMAELDAAFHFT